MATKGGASSKLKASHTVGSLFAAIGGFCRAFQDVGATVLWANEKDKFATKTFVENFPQVRHFHKPIEQLSVGGDALQPVDILTAGFPCQPFSCAGERRGFADERGMLFLHIIRLIREFGASRPKILLLENVQNFRTHDKGKTFKIIVEHLQNLGYHIYTEVLNALDFGLPQKRERTYIVGFLDNINFDFPKPVEKRMSLSDILEPDEQVDQSLFASEFIQKKRLEKLKVQPFYPSIWHENKSGNISVLPYSCALRSGASYNYLLVNGIRRLSSRELLRLQGFPEGFKIVVSHAEIRKQTGNSVPVPVVRAIAKQMLNGLLVPINVGAGSEKI